MYKKRNYAAYINETLNIPSKSQYTGIDLFAGCGGLSLGFEAAGVKLTGYEMVESFSNTYKKNFGGRCHQQKLSVGCSLPEVDIVIGGPPCQPFSVSGNQKGAEDDRNGFPVFIDAIRRIKPKVFLFENVRGVLYRNRDYFSQVISQLEALGYKLTYKLINAVDYEVPQNRQRVICVGSRLGHFDFPKACENKVTAGEAIGSLINQDFDPSLLLTPSMDAYIAAYEKKSHCINPRDLHMDKPARTLTCRNLAGATSDMHRLVLPDGRRRRLTVREAARLQSFPDWFDFTGSIESQYTQIGNAVPPMLAYHIAKALIKHIQNPAEESGLFLNLSF